VIAYGDEAAQEAVGGSDRLADSQEYKDAAGSLGDGYTVGTWIAIKPILDLVEGMPVNDPAWTQVKPYLEPLGVIVSGAKADGDKVSSVMRVTVP
jgi:hypothetical protein